MIGYLLAAAVGLLHLYILWIEMFRWEAPRTRAAFGGLDADFAAKTKVLAANQGLYNGFLAAGIFWGLWRGDQGVVMFFLACVAVAGLYGAATASRRILFVQTVPAVVAMLMLVAGI